MTYAEIPLNPNFRDINPVRAGVAFSTKKTGYPLSKTWHTVIHYVSSGSGFVHIDGQSLPVSAGQIFIIPAGHFAYYKCNEHDPWAYRWVGFTGSLSHAFEKFPRVLDVPETFLDILHTTHLPDLPRNQVAYQLTADLFSLYSRLSGDLPEHIDDTLQRVHDVTDYIQANCEKTSVMSIAQHFGYERSYLCKQFKRYIGCSIQQYILDTRLQKALWMLERGTMIKEVAALCGFSDASNFSKAFTRWLDMTPSEYIQMMKNDYDAFRNGGTD